MGRRVVGGIYSVKREKGEGGWGMTWKLWALRPQKPLRLVRDGEVGGSGLIYLTPTRYTVTTTMILH